MITLGSHVIMMDSHVIVMDSHVIMMDSYVIFQYGTSMVHSKIKPVCSSEE